MRGRDDLVLCRRRLGSSVSLLRLDDWDREGGNEESLDPVVRRFELLGRQDGHPVAHAREDERSFSARELAVDVERDAEDVGGHPSEVSEGALTVGGGEAELGEKEFRGRGRRGEGGGSAEEGGKGLEDGGAEGGLSVEDVGEERDERRVERFDEVGRILAVPTQERPDLPNERLPHLGFHPLVARARRFRLGEEVSRERDKHLAEVAETSVGDRGLQEGEEPRARLGGVAAFLEPKRHRREDPLGTTDLDRRIEDAFRLALPLEPVLLAHLANQDEHLAQEDRRGGLRSCRGRRGGAETEAEEEGFGEGEDVREGAGGVAGRGEGFFDELDQIEEDLSLGGGRGRLLLLLALRDGAGGDGEGERGVDFRVGNAVADLELKAVLDRGAEGGRGRAGEEGEDRGEDGGEGGEAARGVGSAVVAKSFSSSLDQESKAGRRLTGQRRPFPLQLLRPSPPSASHFPRSLQPWGEPR